MSLDPEIVRARLDSARLYLIFTRGLCRLPPEEVLGQALTAGVDMIQVREPSMPDRELLEWIHDVRDLAAGHHVPLIVNDRPDLALLAAADGVHLGQGDLPPRAVRELLGPERIIGLSTHGDEQVQRSREEPIDYIGIGPIHDTVTKGLPGRGLELLQRSLPLARKRR